MERFTHVVAEAVATKRDSGAIHVVFVASRDGGAIRKLSHDPKTRRTCLVELLLPFEGRDGAAAIRNMRFLPSTSSLYLATSDGVMRVPAHRCGRFGSRQQCLNAMDPYCGWNRQKNECTNTPNRNPRAAYWTQDAITCPVLTDPVRSRIRVAPRSSQFYGLSQSS